jgi:pimeloyl-ACP methyl ester carboxylesterase
VSECYASLDGIDVCYETLGDPDGRPLLLIMGLSGPLIWWDNEFCQMLVDRGFYVVRYDNRDAGRTMRNRAATPPWRIGHRLRAVRSGIYSLDAMTQDAIGLLDHLGLATAHVVGASMGGMIGQLLAIRYPERVESLVSIMSSTSSRRVGQPHPKLLRTVLRLPPRTSEEYVDYAVRIFRAIGSPGYPLDEEWLRERATQTHSRGVDVLGVIRQVIAIAAARNRTRALRRLTVPAAVIHGSEDPLVHVSGGRATADAIPDAELMLVPGMGHDLPLELWPDFVDLIDRTAGRAEELAAGTLIGGPDIEREAS